MLTILYTIGTPEKVRKIPYPTKQIGSMIAKAPKNEGMTLSFSLVEHIGNISGEDHVKEARYEQRDQQAVSQHAVHDLPLVLGHSRNLGYKGDPDQQAHTHDHGADRDRARVGIGAAEIQHSFFLKKPVQAESYACHL